MDREALFTCNICNRDIVKNERYSALASIIEDYHSDTFQDLQSIAYHCVVCSDCSPNIESLTFQLKDSNNQICLSMSDKNIEFSRYQKRQASDYTVVVVPDEMEGELNLIRGPLMDRKPYEGLRLGLIQSGDGVSGWCTKLYTLADAPDHIKELPWKQYFEAHELNKPLG